MARRLRVICTVAVACLAGCQSDNIVTTQSVVARAFRPRSEGGTPSAQRGQDGHDTPATQPPTCAEMIQYLHDQNLAELESVEVWENEYGPGLKLTTAHYEIFTTLLGPSMLCRSPGFIESAYRAYNRQLPEPVETKPRFVIYLFADRRQWEDFTRNFAGEQAELFCRIRAGAYYHCQTCVAYDIGPERTFSVLGHEGWHQFNDRHFEYRLPSWLDEGVAMLFEAPLYEDGALGFEPADNTYRLEALKKTLDKGRMMPLEELIATTPGDVLATDQAEAVMAFYSQSYALVRFLQEADCGRRLAAYHQLLADGLRGDWPLDEVSRKIAADRTVPRNILWNHIVGLVLFQEYISADFEPVEQEYLDFCRQLVADY